MNELTTTNPMAQTNATTDDQLIALFLRTKNSERTRQTYSTALSQFLAFVDHQPLPSIRLEDLVSYKEHLATRYTSASTQTLKLNAIKSLLTFAQEVGYLRFNVGAAVKPPAIKNTLAERILTEGQIQAMIHKCPIIRDQLLLRVLYATGGRVSEIVNLNWRDFQPNDDTGQLTVFGKGGKTRVIKLPQTLCRDLFTYRHTVPDGEDDPLFRSQKGNRLSRSRIAEIVTREAMRSGIEGNVSPHWFRHSHASHSIERGASLALVQSTLGHSSVSTTSGYLHARPDDSSAMYLPI